MDANLPSSLSIFMQKEIVSCSHWTFVFIIGKQILYEVEYETFSEIKICHTTKKRKSQWNCRWVKYVHISWEGHKIMRNIHLTFVLFSASQSKVRWRLRKILLSSQNIWTLEIRIHKYFGSSAHSVVCPLSVALSRYRGEINVLVDND